MQEPDRVEIVEAEVVEDVTLPERARRVRVALARSVQGFIEAGAELLKARPDIPHGGWVAWLKEEVRISQPTAHKLMALASHPAIANHSHENDLPRDYNTLYELSRLEAQWLEAAIGAGRVHPELERKAARELVVEYKQRAAEVSFEVRHGDFVSALEEAIEPGTLDAVITDPPYSTEFLPLYEKLSACAERWLVPGGVCAVMCGQMHFLEAARRLTTHLEYWWMVTYLTPGGQAVQIFPRKVNTFWKPVVVLKKKGSEPTTAEWFGDVASSQANDNDKRFHHWGQSESGMGDLIKRLTEPGQRVADPFMGAGTTGVAAISLGRSFVGCDVNADHVESARERLEDTVVERLGEKPRD